MVFDDYERFISLRVLIIDIMLSLNVERPIRGPDIPCRHQHHVHQGPHPDAAEAEQLADPLLPVAQVEPVSPEAAQGDGEQQCRGPAVALGPVALPPLGEDGLAQAEGVPRQAAVGDVPVGLAARRPDTATT